MGRAIFASLTHCASTDGNPMQDNCDVQWCWYKMGMEKEEPDSHEDHKYNFLTWEVARKCIPVYHKAAKKDFLSRMLHNKTTNANECLNSKIWVRCLDDFADLLAHLGCHMLAYLSCAISRM